MGNPVYGAGLHAGIEIGKQLGRQELAHELARFATRVVRGVAQIVVTATPVVARQLSETRKAKRRAVAD